MGKKQNHIHEVAAICVCSCKSLFESKGRPGSSHTGERKKMPCPLPGAHGFLQKSLVHVPDFRQQRWELLVLEAEGENLLRVDAAERAQAHQLHQHAGEHQVILRRHLTASLMRPRP